MICHQIGTENRVYPLFNLIKSFIVLYVNLTFKNLSINSNLSLPICVCKIFTSESAIVINVVFFSVVGRSLNLNSADHYVDYAF